MRVLVADDERTTRVLLGEQLTAWGYEPVYAVNGVETLELLRAAAAPRLVLLDWVMPDVTGVEICQSLKASQPAAYTYVILLTSKDGKKDVITGLESGADDFIVKPADPELLRSRLGVAVRILRYEGQLADKNRQLSRYASEMHKLAEERAKQLVHADRMAALGMMSAGIAHEINNPNNFIAFNIPILRDYVDAVAPIVDAHASRHPDLSFWNMPYAEFRDDLYRLLGNIEHGSQRISATVSGLNGFARKREAGELTLVSAWTVCARAAAICRSHLRKTVASFEMDVAADPPCVFTDADALEQVLVNLLINAAQAADKEDSRVRLSARKGPSPAEYLVIEVSDNGEGIERGRLAQIFDPFVTTKPPGEGTGLGLYISRTLVEGLGGRIEVESEVGTGSTFRVFVPDGGDAAGEP